MFDGTPASTCGELEAGDELTGVNKISVKGKTKTEVPVPLLGLRAVREGELVGGKVARMIQSTEGEVLLNYNKLHADPKQGKSLDIVLKKMKHKMVLIILGILTMRGVKVVYLRWRA